MESAAPSLDARFKLAMDPFSQPGPRYRRLMKTKQELTYSSLPLFYMKAPGLAGYVRTRGRPYPEFFHTATKTGSVPFVGVTFFRESVNGLQVPPYVN